MNSNPVLSKTHTPTHSAILPGWFLSTPSFLSKLVFSHPLKRSRLVLHQLITLIMPSGMPSCSSLAQIQLSLGNSLNTLKHSALLINLSPQPPATEHLLSAGHCGCLMGWEEGENESKREPSQLSVLSFDTFFLAYQGLAVGESHTI